MKIDEEMNLKSSKKLNENKSSFANKIIEETKSPVVEIYGIEGSVCSEKIFKNQKIKCENNAQNLRC